MNKSIGYIAMLVLVFAFLAAPALAVPATMISGKITSSDGTTPVPGADVSVKCNGNTVATSTDGAGMYYVFYTSTQCPNGSEVTVQASSDGMNGEKTAEVALGLCRINTAIVNVSIPEFGVIAGAMALVAGLGIVLLRRD